MIELQLHENWQLCDIKKQDWIPAQVPGDIYSALLKAEKMPDPFFGDNEYQAKALMEEDYEYRTVFTYDEKQFENCQEVILRFDGIDTIGDIYLNGTLLGSGKSRQYAQSLGISGWRTVTGRREYTSGYHQITVEIHGRSF